MPNSESDNPRLQAALSYLARGWSIASAHYVISAEDAVLRCSCRQISCTKSQGKHPNISWRAYIGRHPTVNEVQTWWRRKPEANVAVVTGEISGLVVVDIDPRHGGDLMWEGVKEQEDVPETLTVITASGGQHLYFQHPGHYVKGLVGVLDGVDVRSDGNIVIAPPSRNFTPDGNGGWKASEYRWWDPDQEIAPLPPFVERLIEEAGRRGVSTTSKRVDWRIVLDSDNVKCREGQRNDVMTAMAGHWAGKGHSVSQVERLCLGANQQKFEPPLEESEVQKIVSSIMKMENEKRRGAEAAQHLLEDEAETAEQYTPGEALAAAAALWETANVPAVTDWYLLRGEENEYILVTPEDEVSLGNDLLNMTEVRRRLLNDIRVLMPMDKETRESWPTRALALRRLAREEIVEPTRAEERVQEWLEQYILYSDPQVVEVQFRRDKLREGAILSTDRSGTEYLTLRVQSFANYVRWTGDEIKNRDLRKLLLRAGWTEHPLRVEGSTTRVLRTPWTRPPQTDQPAG